MTPLKQGDLFGQPALSGVVEDLGPAENPGSAAGGASASDYQHSARASHLTPESALDPRSCQATLPAGSAATWVCPVCDGPARCESKGKLWRCDACEIAFDRPRRSPIKREAGIARNP
jgi:ribosomal protein L37AE/L43A